MPEDVLSKLLYGVMFALFLFVLALLCSSFAWFRNTIAFTSKENVIEKREKRRTEAGWIKAGRCHRCLMVFKVKNTSSGHLQNLQTFRVKSGR